MERPPRPGSWIPLAALAALGILLFAPVLFGGRTLIATDFLEAHPLWRGRSRPVRNVHLSDTIEYYYPVERIYSEAARRGRLPVVNPYVFNGAPVPHGVHAWNSVWPVKLLFLWLFDPVRSYDLYAIFHWWLAGAAFFGLLRTRGIGNAAAFAAALAYALSSRSATWLHGHYLMPTMAYAPLAFLALVRRPSLAAVPVAGLFFTNPHAGIAVSLALAVYDRKAWKPVLAGLLMAGVALVPLAAAVRQGLRDPAAEAEWFYRDRWGCWRLLGGLLSPGTFNGAMPFNEHNAYIGILPLGLALFGLRRERFFAALAGLALAAATCWPLPRWIAPLSFSLPTRYLFLFPLGACACFARALDGLPLRPGMKAAAAVLVLADLAPRFLDYNRPYDPAILRERPAWAEAVRGRAGVFLPDSPAIGRHFFPPLSLFGIESVQGYDVAVPRAQAEALGGAGRVAGGRVIVLDDPEHPALDALGMKFLITDTSFAPRRFRPAGSFGAVRIYENPAAREVPPRTFPFAPYRIGLALTLAGCVLGGLLGLRDRPRPGEGHHPGVVSSVIYEFPPGPGPGREGETP